jgi:hypothetical protein
MPEIHPQDDTDAIVKLAKEGGGAELAALLAARGGALSLEKEEVDYECGDYDDWATRNEYNRYAIGRADAGTSLTALAGALAANTTVTAVNFTKNAIDDAGAVALAAQLANNAAVTEINFRFNQIGDAGAEALIALLTANARITAISLDYNGVGEALMQRIAALCQVCVRARMLEKCECCVI